MAPAKSYNLLTTGNDRYTLYCISLVVVAPFAKVIVAVARLFSLSLFTFSVSNVTSTVAPLGNSSICPPSFTRTNVLLSSSVNFSYWIKLITGRTSKLYPTLKNPRLCFSVSFPEVSAVLAINS